VTGEALDAVDPAGAEADRIAGLGDVRHNVGFVKDFLVEVSDEVPRATSTVSDVENGA
jgi:hypothetical protein